MVTYNSYATQKNNLNIIQFNDKIDEAHINEINNILMQCKRKEILKAHKPSVWQNKTNGYWYTRIDGKLVRKKELITLEDVIVQNALSKEQEVNPTIEELFYEWANDRLMRKTIKKGTHERLVSTFKRHYGDIKDKRITSMSDIDWCKFIEAEAAKYDLDSKGLAKVKEIARGSLTWAKRQRYIYWSIDDMLKMVDVKPRKVYKDESTQVYNKDELAAYRKYLITHMSTGKNKNNHKDIALLLASITGMRPGELVALRHEDIHDSSIDVRGSESRYHDNNHNYIKDVDKPKTEAGYRNIVIPAGNDWILDIMRAFPQYPDGYVFRKENGERMTCNSLTSYNRRALKKMGLLYRSTNKLRKTYASILLDAKTDNNLVIKQMGHTSLDITESAYHRDRKDESEKSRKLSEIDELVIKSAI